MGRTCPSTNKDLETLLGCLPAARIAAVPSLSSRLAKPRQAHSIGLELLTDRFEGNQLLAGSLLTGCPLDPVDVSDRQLTPRKSTRGKPTVLRSRA